MARGQLTARPPTDRRSASERPTPQRRPYWPERRPSLAGVGSTARLRRPAHRRGDARAPPWRGRWRRRRRRGGEQRRALLGRQRAPGAAEDAGGFGGEVPAAGEQLRGGAVGDHAAVGEQHRALGAGAGELGVVGGDDHRLAARGAAAQLLGELSLGEAVHPACGLVEREHRGLLAPVGDDRERQPLALPAGEVAGVARGLLGEAGERKRARGSLARRRARARK